MDKENILAISRKENVGGDERAQSIKLQASHVSKAVGIAFCFVLNILDELIFHSGILGLGCALIYLTMFAVELWVVGLRLDKKYISLAVLFTIIDILGIIAMVLNYTVFKEM